MQDGEECEGVGVELVDIFCKHKPCYKRGCKSARAQIVKSGMPEKLTLSDNTDLAHACDLFTRTAIQRRTLGFLLMLCCVLSCVAVSLGGCCIFTPAAATCFVINFTWGLNQACGSSSIASPLVYAPNTLPHFLARESWPWSSSCATFYSGNHPVSISESPYLYGCRVGEAKVPGPRKREAANSGWEEGFQGSLKSQCHVAEGK